MFTRKIIALVSGAVLIGAGSIGAVSASASGDPDTPVACVVTGTATVHGETNNVPRTPGNTNGFFNSTTISCQPAAASDDGGTFTVSANFKSNGDEDCAAGTGTGYFTGGTSTSADPADSTVDTDNATEDGDNTFTYTRAGTVVHVTGNIATHGTDPSTGATVHENHDFHAVLNFTPTSGPCIGGAAGSDTVADLDGTAVITSDNSDSS